MILTLHAYRNDIHVEHPLRWWNEAKVDGVSRDPEFPASGHCWQKLLLHNEWEAIKHSGTSKLMSMYLMPVRHLLHLIPTSASMEDCVTFTSVCIWLPHQNTAIPCSLQ